MATGQSDPANENMRKELSSSTILCGSNQKQCWKHNADSGGWAYESMSKCEFCWFPSLHSHAHTPTVTLCQVTVS